MKPLPPRLQACFLDPSASGPLEGATALGRAANAACGDDLGLGLWLEGQRVTRARFQARGCSALIAVAGLTCAHLEGRSVDELGLLDLEGLIAAAGGLPARGAHAGAVVRRALDEAVQGLAARYP